MHVLRIAFVASLAATSAPIASAAPLPGSSLATSVAAYVSEAARRFSLPERWIYAVMRVESAGNPRAVSSKGAAGLMQIMPATWDGLRARYGLGSNIYDVHDNIVAGAAFLREMYDRYGAAGFLAAYNAGPGRYENYLASGRPLPAETVAYVTRLAPIVAGEAVMTPTIAVHDPRAWTRAALFSRRSGRTNGDAGSAAGTAIDTPPSIRPTTEISSVERPAVGLFVPFSGQIER